ncbi:MAG: tRNA (adenosine(37)-N6)-threonylcarbamoyltransferase complex transferase subunit TsaD [Verrucomicrobia bacterium]|nr:tRNA (adenosine(37)-N6)-threonylcarbamoyltransferase complex transferase subunit TsaD [Verrucomicrobiota bacterium]
MSAACILALETSCDETAVAIVRGDGAVLSSVVASQIEIHRVHGGVVPELASRNHVLHARALVEQALTDAGLTLKNINAFAATVGPGLVSSLLIGSTLAKALALAEGKPFLAINHLEGHLLSPFMSLGEIPPHLALIVSGGHTMLLDVRGIGEYEVLGRTRDDAAGEAFDKVAKMLALPYPGGPEIDQHASSGNRQAFDFPRSMLGGGYDFSFSGLKTSVLYLLPKLNLADAAVLNDVCASFQEAVIDVLVEKTLSASRDQNQKLIAISGGVSCNTRLRKRFAERCTEEGLQLLLAEPRYTTDNAAMIAFAAMQRWKTGYTSPLETDVDPNFNLAAFHAG